MSGVIKVPKRIISWAHEKHTGRKYNGRTIKEEGNGQITGHIGEWGFNAFLSQIFHPNELEWSSMDGCYDYDFKVGRATIDVKTCSRTVPPKASFSGYVEEKSFQQFSPHAYVFATFNWTTEDLAILGYADRGLFKKISRFVGKGEVDDGKAADCDCRKITYSDIERVSSLFYRLEGMLYQDTFGGEDAA